MLYDLASLRSLTAYRLATMADAGNPDAPDSAGARFLVSVRDATCELLERANTEETDRDDLDDDGSLHQIADDAPDVYTGTRWAEFADLAAYTEDLSEMGGCPTDDDGAPDLTAAAGVALYIIARRLTDELVTLAADTAEEMADGIDTDRARTIAGEWHGGQGSALYAFSSSGAYMVDHHGLTYSSLTPGVAVDGADRRDLAGEVYREVAAHPSDVDLRLLADYCERRLFAPVGPVWAMWHGGAGYSGDIPTTADVHRFDTVADAVAELDNAYRGHGFNGGGDTPCVDAPTTGLYLYLTDPSADVEPGGWVTDAYPDFTVSCNWPTAPDTDPAPRFDTDDHPVWRVDLA